MATSKAPRQRDRAARQAGINQLAALALLVIAAGVAGCGSTTHALLRSARDPLAKPPSPIKPPAATVRIITPKGNALVAGAFTARVSIQGSFRIISNPQIADDQPDSGHYHFILDHGRYDQPQYSGTNGRIAVTKGANGYYSPAYTPTITYQHIPPGPHTLKVELVTTNDAPTGVNTAVSFRVR